MKASSLQNTRHSCWCPGIINNSSYSLYSHYQPGSVLYVTLSHLIVTTSLWGRYCYPPCFTDSSSQTYVFEHVLGTRGNKLGLCSMRFFSSTRQNQKTVPISAFLETKGEGNIPFSACYDLSLVRPLVVMMMSINTWAVRITTLLGLRCAHWLRTLLQGHSLYSHG